MKTVLFVYNTFTDSIRNVTNRLALESYDVRVGCDETMLLDLVHSLRNVSVDLIIFDLNDGKIPGRGNALYRKIIEKFARPIPTIFFCPKAHSGLKEDFGIERHEGEHLKLVTTGELSDEEFLSIIMKT